jgi:predicted Zn-dependent protease
MQGEILAARGNLRQAVDVLEQAARTDQSNAPKEYLARVLDLAGDRERAKLIYQSIAGAPGLLWSSTEDDRFGMLRARRYVRTLKGE